MSGPSLAHRLGEAVVTVLGPDGTPAAHADVVVEQVRHEVAFGCTGFDAPGLPGDPALERLWLEVFDTVTLPFYWARHEPERGRPATEAVTSLARWFAERGVRCKGHPLLWHTLTPRWLDDLPTEAVAAAVDARVRRDVAAFRGLVTTWDVVNEAVIMPVFANEPDGRPRNAVTRLCHERGRVATVRDAFAAARETDPDAVLLLNDFDLSTAYECLVEGLLAAGVPIDALGLQTHMHQGYRGEEATWEVLERFARFGLPLHLTETTLLSGELMPAHIEDLNDFQPESWPSTPEGEARQADEVVRHYRTLLAHPAVASVTYWGLTDHGAWLGAPAGLVRADGSPKPAHTALRGLVRGQWWHEPRTYRSDADGRVRVSGWRGDYEARTAGAVTRFALGPAPAR